MADEARVIWWRGRDSFIITRSRYVKDVYELRICVGSGDDDGPRMHRCVGFWASPQTLAKLLREVADEIEKLAQEG